MADLETVAESLIKGQAPAVDAGVRQALEEEVPVRDILHQGLIAGMNVVGEKFKSNEFYIPEGLIATRAMKVGLELIRPQMVAEKVEPLGKACIGTVKGDLHDIGKNLVGMMLEGAGFEVVDLGIDVPPEKFVEAAREHDIQIVCMSALLTTTMGSMQSTVEALKEAGLGDQVRTLIGGAPITQAFADKIGADGFAEDAASATEAAKELVTALSN
ncbi:MAG TPA: cobalamin-binding protein [Candidatus Latescibacteria bacterium]|nr:cobalamin-binding protein [Candidatus Latescibacterota bacterium]